MRGLGPGGRAPRLEPAQLLRRPDEAAEGIEITLDHPRGPGLNENIADGRGLHGTGNDGSLAGISSELAQQRIVCPAPDKMDHVNRSTR